MKSLYCILSLGSSPALVRSLALSMLSRERGVFGPSVLRSGVCECVCLYGVNVSGS